MLVGSGVLSASPAALYVQPAFLRVVWGQTQFFPKPASLRHALQLLRLQVRLFHLAPK